MGTFVLVHGATGGGWYWRPVATRLRAAGHEVHTPSLTGHGERVHLATPDTGLDTHIEDVVNVLVYEDLRGVVLVGKSYAGAVITGVASRATDRLAHLVYLDAAVPRDGQSVADVVGSAIGPAAVEGAIAQMRAAGDGWRAPVDNLSEPRLTPHPIKAYVDPLPAGNPDADRIPRTYIYCTQTEPGLAAAMTGHGAKVARDAGWAYHELPTGHNPERTMPGEVAALLLSIV